MLGRVSSAAERVCASTDPPVFGRATSCANLPTPLAHAANGPTSSAQPPSAACALQPATPVRTRAGGQENVPPGEAVAREEAPTPHMERCGLSEREKRAIAAERRLAMLAR